LQRVAKQKVDVGISHRRGYRVLVLFRGNRDPGNHGAIVTMQRERGGAVAAADVAHPLARPDRSPPGDQPGQVNCRFFGGFFSCDPVAVMNVGSPNASVKIVEVVIMGGDGRNVGDS
jgi:hypothetical protein